MGSPGFFFSFIYWCFVIARVFRAVQQRCKQHIQPKIRCETPARGPINGLF